MCGFLMLLLEQHAVIFTSINLLVVHAETSHDLLAVVQVLRHVMVQRDEINNQLHNIVVTVTQTLTSSVPSCTLASKASRSL
jgi:hypothetical protein